MLFGVSRSCWLGVFKVAGLGFLGVSGLGFLEVAGLGFLGFANSGLVAGLVDFFSKPCTLRGRTAAPLVCFQDVLIPKGANSFTFFHKEGGQFFTFFLYIEDNVCSLLPAQKELTNEKLVCPSSSSHWSDRTERVQNNLRPLSLSRRVSLNFANPFRSSSANLALGNSCETNGLKGTV